ncbi:hypothetical protein GCM10017667_03590 [Streptomyces filamentosus]|uniref:Uncharacterized protein n=1 Tax=Streptomyces filamentosus TaxID=67294 RepID=A0A919BCE2_STRFL|nr:hypothetical protein GCM10017667_03590 [Streptomyces filamentosus]
MGAAGGVVSGGSAREQPVTASTINRLAASGRCTGRPPSVGKVWTYIACGGRDSQEGVVGGVRFTGNVTLRSRFPGGS